MSIRTCWCQILTWAVAQLARVADVHNAPQGLRVGEGACEAQLWVGIQGMS